jgi:hypothetical protein
MFHVNLNTKPKRGKRNQVRKNNGKKVIPITTHTLKQFQNITLHKSLNIDLYGVSSKSKVFPTWVSGNFENKTSRFLCKIGFLG